MSINLVNLTGHPIAIYRDDQIIARFPRSPTPARVNENLTPIEPLHLNGVDIPRSRVTYTDHATNLPDPQDGTWLIVSRIVAFAHPARADLLFPVHEVRDTDGRILGCRAFGTATTAHQHPPRQPP
ncbi:hypothetical protein [Nocardia sp. CA-119907]|uniref:hypothetical protein n=1 Tax=Nocardia sp. CA-119907 TaxID=3239973 RepID=UPI003D95CE23